MTVSTLGQVEALRETLIETIWPAGGYPSDRRVNSVESYSSSYFGQTENAPALVNFAGIDRLAVQQYLGVHVRPLHFKPTVSRGEAMLFMIGHDGGPFTVQSRNVVYRLLAQGFDVVTVAMPLYFAEDRPLIGNVQLGLEHGDLAQFQDPGWHPLDWFLTPAIAAMNYLEEAYGYSEVSMTGYSGGGWATYLLAALDVRITRSYPVTGGPPLDVRVGTENGDWEQYQVDVFADPIADYRDLYVMAADRAGRSQLLMVNELDAIFPDLGRAAVYGPPLTTICSGLGGSWDYWIEAGQTEHVISDQAVDEMFADMGIALW